MVKFLSVFLIIIDVGFIGVSKIWQREKTNLVVKESPSKAYRVKIELREERGTGTRIVMSVLESQSLRSLKAEAHRHNTDGHIFSVGHSQLRQPFLPALRM